MSPSVTSSSTRYHAQGRRFAAPGRPDQDDKFLIVNDKISPLHGFNPAREDLLDVLEFYFGHRTFTSSNLLTPLALMKSGTGRNTQLLRMIHSPSRKSQGSELEVSRLFDNVLYWTP